MDDLSDTLQALLSSPGTMEKLQGLLSSVGTPTPPPAPPPAPTAEGADLSMLTRLLPLFGQMQRESEDTALLRALRPYLHGEREKRLDGAIQMVRLAELLPLLQGAAELPKGGS